MKCRDCIKKKTCTKNHGFLMDLDNDCEEGESKMMTFDEYFDNEYEGPVSRDDAKVIWEAAQNVINGQMIKALIPKFGEK